jgi:hypothetical protein
MLTLNFVFAQDSPLTVQTDTTKHFIPGDSLALVAEPINDSSTVKKTMKIYSPRKAAIRSAILPGLGQIYNKKYWKLPIVYGALGTSGAVFAYNLQWYRRTRYAYKVLFNHDTANYSNIHPRLQVFVQRDDPSSLQNLRNSYRHDIDFSALIFILIWGLNVADAAVDAHLKSFDVSPDLSFNLKFGASEMAGTTGMSLVMRW